MITCNWYIYILYVVGAQQFADQMNTIHDVVYGFISIFRCFDLKPLDYESSHECHNVQTHAHRYTSVLTYPTNAHTYTQFTKRNRTVSFHPRIHTHITQFSKSLNELKPCKKFLENKYKCTISVYIKWSYSRNQSHVFINFHLFWVGSYILNVQMSFELTAHDRRKNLSHVYVCKSIQSFTNFTEMKMGFIGSKHFLLTFLGFWLNDYFEELRWKCEIHYVIHAAHTSVTHSIYVCVVHIYIYIEHTNLFCCPIWRTDFESSNWLKCGSWLHISDEILSSSAGNILLLLQSLWI